MSATFWPWWAGSISLAAVVALSWLGLRRLLGVSGSLSSALEKKSTESAIPEGVDLAALEAELLAATQAEFGAEAVANAAAAPAAPAPPVKQPQGDVPWTAHATLLGGIVIGSAIAAATHGRFALRWDFGAEFARLFGTGPHIWPLLVAGGVMVGFGTRMAGGCTSGHGLCGNARLQKGSLLATMCFFGTAVVVSLLLDVVRR